MEVVGLPTSLAHPALEAMELLLARIVIIEAAKFAEVFSKPCLALHASLSWLLDERTLIALNFLHILRVKFVRKPLVFLL